jgi:hypothetical protein
MTFLEQYILIHSNGGLSDFQFIDELLEKFQIDIPNNHLSLLKEVNLIIEYIYKKVITEVSEEFEITDLKYSMECNSRASYLSIQDENGNWNNVHSREELRELLRKPSS